MPKESLIPEEIISNDVSLQLEIENIKRKLTRHSKNIELVLTI